MANQDRVPLCAVDIQPVVITASFHSFIGHLVSANNQNATRYLRGFLQHRVEYIVTQIWACLAALEGGEEKIENPKCPVVIDSHVDLFGC